MAQPYSVIGDATDPDERIRLEWATLLRDHLDAHELKPKTLAHRLEQEHGIVVTRQAVESWLAGKTAPRPATQAAIAAILRVPPRSLFPLNLPPKASA